MQTKHTPGPWQYSQCELTGRFSIYHNGPLAYCGDTSASPGDGEANARLIAAAPDLLELVLDALDDPDVDILGSAWVRDARAAIAKATGGQA